MENENVEVQGTGTGIPVVVSEPEKVESGEKVPLWVPVITAISVGVVIGMVIRPFFSGVVSDPNVVESKLEKRVGDLQATLYAERTRHSSEMMAKNVELADSDGEKEAQRIAYNNLKVESAREVGEKVKGFLAEKVEMKKESVSRFSARDNEWESKVSSLKAEVASLENRIKILCNGNLKLTDANAEVMRQRDAERDAELKALRKALEKALREKNELLSQLLMSESGIPGVSQVLFSPGERVRILKIKNSDSLCCGKRVIEIEGEREICGNYLSILCRVTDEEAELLEIGKILVMDDEDIFVCDGKSGSVYYLNPKFFRI